MKMRDVLKRNVPEFQQGQESLDGFLNATGDFLDDTKEAIEYLDYAHDYREPTDFFLTNTLKDRGFAIPARINRKTQQRLLRDVAELHRKNGTIDALIHSIRLAGIEPNIRVGWVASPREIRNGFLVDPVSLNHERYDITRYVYTDMLYGDAVVTEEGTFFEGYRYEDHFSEHKIGPLPIYGERYENVPENRVSVANSPYMIVKFDEGNMTIVTDPVTDPNTGEVYEYSISEHFQLVNDVLEYFLHKTNRPTTVRIIIIVSMQPFDEELIIDDDEYEDTHTYNPDGGDDLTDSAALNDDSYTHVAEITPTQGALVGEYNTAGETNIRSRYLVTSGAVSGDGNIATSQLLSVPIMSGTTYHYAGTTKAIQPLRGVTVLTMTPPVSVVMYGLLGTDESTKTQITTFAAGVAVTIPSTGTRLKFDSFLFEYSAPLATDVAVGFTYQAMTL